MMLLYLREKPRVRGSLTEVSRSVDYRLKYNKLDVI